MLLQEIADELQIPIGKANYYREALKKNEMLNPVKVSKYLDYTEEDVHYFRTLHKYLTHDGLTAGEAIKYITQGLTPSQALEINKRLNAELAAARKKIVELRKPTVWEQIGKFFANIFKRKKVDEREAA